MIEKIESFEALDAWRARDIYSVRILALAKSYGFQYNFCTFYRQVEDDRVTALLSRLDNNVTLALAEDYDREELVRFLCITGYSSILTDASFELNPRFQEGEVMASSLKREGTAGDAELDEYPKLMDLFNFVDYGSQDFNAWYVDISHRIRHGTAKAYTLNKDNEVIASGILSSVYDNKAILTAVRTREDKRRSGYGTELVRAICSDVSDEVYIMREDGKNEEFYRQLGFQPVGKWRIYQ